jgi:hypothetical protein
VNNPDPRGIVVNMINELIVGILVIFANVTLRTSGLEKNGKTEEGIPNATKWNTLTRFCNSLFHGINNSSL